MQVKDNGCPALQGCFMPPRFSNDKAMLFWVVRSVGEESSFRYQALEDLSTSSGWQKGLSFWVPHQKSMGWLRVTILCQKTKVQRKNLRISIGWEEKRHFSSVHFISEQKNLLCSTTGFTEFSNYDIILFRENCWHDFAIIASELKQRP